jgi:cyclophilin family peptidyl-prolyl cis-trans isomerase
MNFTTRDRRISGVVLFALALAISALAAPVIDPLPAASVPAGKTLILPVTASAPNGRPLTFTAASSTNRITVEIQTNQLFWKMSVAQVAASNAPGAYRTPFRGGTVTVTNVGDLTFMLFRDLTPHTVDVIQGLTGAGLYTSNTIFHRVVPGFVIQGGDPSTNGTGGPVFRYDDEFHPRAIFSSSGQLALANSGRDTDGSQFFVTLGPQRFLDFGYTLFGQLVRGFNVLTNIINTPADGDSRPLADVIITRASIVPDTFDTVLTLTGTNLAGVAGTITVIADDGAGGRATNTFAATTIADTQNEPPFLYPLTVTNLVAPLNTRLTNTATALDLETNAFYWFIYSLDANATNSLFTLNNSQLRMVIVPNSNYVGSASHLVVVSSDPNWSFYAQYFPQSQWPPYDWQTYTFAFGDTAIAALPNHFAATPTEAFTNRLLATFTNGVPNSAAAGFTASVNWGDNSISSGTIVTNLSGRKEVRGTHTYTNAGNYAVYIALQSAAGAGATLVSTASVQPGLTLARTGATNVVRWPAWATDYQLQSAAGAVSANWQAVTNISWLAGYENTVTNQTTNGFFFFRLMKPNP